MNFPTFKLEYGLYNALIVSIMGFISTVSGGIISDRFEKSNRMTKALVCMVGSALAIPAITLCVLNPTNFYRSLFFMGVKFLVSECWMSPAITMMQNSVKPSEQGSIVSAHLFYMTAIGCLSTVVLGQCVNIFGAVTNPAVYGKLIWLWSMIGYVGSIPCFWKAGKVYKEFVDKKEKEA